MTDVLKVLKVSAWPVFVGMAVLLFLLSGCNQAGKGFTGGINNSFQGGAPSNIPQNPYPASFVNGLNNAINNTEEVSASDAQALRNYVGNAADINPSQMDEAFSERLKEEMRKIVELEKKGFDQTAQRAQIAALASEACINKAMGHWPKPGWALTGEYGAILCASGQKEGKTSKPKEPPKPSEIRFMVQGEGYPKGPNLFQYAIQGSIKGVGTAQTDGTMIVDAGEWNGYLTDRGGFRGELLNQRYKQKPTGWDTCLIKPKLIRSMDPTRMHLAEFAKQLSFCYKRAMAFVGMGGLEGVPEPLRPFLQQQMLGM